MNGFDWNAWGPPLVVLAAGLVVGAFLALRSRKDSSQAVVADQSRSRRAVLEAKKAALYNQIRTLDADVEKLDRARFLAEREALVAAATDVVRALDAPDEAPAPEPETTTTETDGRALKAGLWVAGVMVFFGLLGMFLTEFSSQRNQGDSLTGNIATGVAERESAEVLAARTLLETEPNNLEALNLITYEALISRQLDEAMAMLDRARAIDPNNADVACHLAILQLSVGMFDKADEAISAALQAQPDRGRYHLWLGLLRMYQNRTDEAIVAIEKSLALGIRTDEQNFARSLLAEARNPQPAATPASVTTTPAGQPTYSGPDSGPVKLSGTVQLADGTEDIAGRTVFVMVYPSADVRMPLATLKLAVADLPFTYSFLEGHAMQGAPWPDTVWVTAKIDADGSAGSSAGDVTIERAGPITVGAPGPTLALPGAGAAAAPPEAPAPPDANAIFYAGAGGGPVQLAGRVALADGVEVHGDRVVYLIVYGAATGGRPVATARLKAADLPIAFSFEQGHAMTGGPWPEQFWVKARVDADGSPGASTGDVDSPILGPLKPGTVDVELTPGAP